MKEGVILYEYSAVVNCIKYEVSRKKTNVFM